jgi:hypothetical protein
MIKKIAVIPYVSNGRGVVGYDGHLNIFKPNRSAVLKQNLEKCLLAENINVKIIVDTDFGDLESLKREAVDLFIITPQAALFVNQVYYKDIDMEECFKLNYEEYETGDVSRIVEYIRRKIKERR